MVLILEVISYRGTPTLEPVSARFDQGGGSIGRSYDNHLTLPDQDKIISRHHGDIRYENGGFVYRDVSTGGTWFCNENRLLENGNTLTLHDGDRLKIGEYELQVKFEASGQSFPGLLAGMGGHQEFGEQGIQNSFDLNITPLFSDDPLIPPLSQNEAPKASSSDSFINQPDVSAFQQNFSPPGILPIAGDFFFDDILSDASASAPVSGKADDLGFPDDWFGDLGLGTDAAKRPAPATESPVPLVQSALLPGELFPASSPAPAVVQVDPLDFEVLADPPIKSGRFDPALSQADPIHADVNQNQWANSAPSSVQDATLIRQNQENVKPPLAEKPSANVERQTAMPAENPAAIIDIPQPGRPIPPARVASVPSAAEYSPPPIVNTTEVPNPKAEESARLDLFKCFLEGAEIADGFPPLTQQEQIKAMRSVGRVYREMVDGMMRVLLARKMEKSMIALQQSDVTQYRRGEYNPLKIFPTPEETIEEMVCQKNPAYIGPAEAVREGFADIQNHQMAMRAGMQAAMGGFLKRVNPKEFEEMFKEGIVFQKKTKCWDAYCKAYPKLVEEAMEDLFGETFAQAYREQLRQLRQTQQTKG